MTATRPRILVACEFSGTVRTAFELKGWDAWSCDLLPTEKPGQHIQGDALAALYGQPWDLAICHPPCTFLTTSGARWFSHPEDMEKPYDERRPHPLYPNRRTDQAAALDFVRRMLAAPVKRIAVENPVGVIATHIRKPDQLVQPYQFGHDAAKGTCLWLKNLPPLRPTQHVPPRITGTGAKRWANQVEASGANKLPPSADRWKLRSVTYAGIADAMADQWGTLDANGRPIEYLTDLFQ